MTLSFFYFLDSLQVHLDRAGTTELPPSRWKAADLLQSKKEKKAMDFTNYTGNEEFNKNGFIVVRNLVDKEAFKEDVPSKENYMGHTHLYTNRYQKEGFH